ncbi:hypothetical protein L6452_36303 [Arctium lappa]|uniref:Uncharacterized protein n=1 Tax=Arctium lappa TaxID=4217 RepID=A0ACB8Y9Y4_ARCLA|nr:hypothetical protein L6452_36303 [Arctium lappa]
MSRCVPSWNLEDVNTNHDVFRLEYEVAELKWENGQLAMHELGSQRVPSKSQSDLPKYMWEKPRAAETLEAIVNQATLQPYCKTQVAVDDDDELVPWLNHHQLPTAAAGSVNASATMTSDALVPSSNNRADVDVRSGQARQSTMSARDTGCSTRVGSCSGDPSAFVDRMVARGGGTTAETHDWSSCRDQSVSESGTFATLDTYEGDLDVRRLTSTSTRLPENTSSGKDFSNSTSPDDSVSHSRSQRGASIIKEKKRVKVKSSISNKRRRTPAIHNQSERKRRDKINERMKTLQKLVPNSSKTDKASMLEEIIEYVKQLQAYVHMTNRMNMSSMMMPLAMQQQQMHMSMMNSMGMGMGMGMRMGIGGMDMNPIGGSNIPTGFHPSTFMHMPSWNGHTTIRAANSTALVANPMYTFLGCQPPQPMHMDAYSRMATLYQHMQNQSCAQNSKK